MSEPHLTPELRAAAIEFHTARLIVQQEIAERSARMQLATYGQMPSWPRYEPAEREWDRLSGKLLDDLAGFTLRVGAAPAPQEGP